MKYLAVLALSLTASAAFAADYHFATPQTPQSIQETLTIVRTVADCLKVSAAPDNATVTFTCLTDDFASAVTWILGVLDTGSETGIHQITLADGGVLRIDFLRNVTSPQSMQEALTVLRTVADIQKVFNYTARHAVVVRATSSQMSFGVWLLDQMNQPADAPLMDAAYSGITDRGQLARVDCLSGASMKRTQQVLTVLRTVAEIQKVFNYTARRELALRADRQYIAMADWLVHQLNDAQPAAPHEYTGPETDDTIRIFALPKDTTDTTAQAALTELRTIPNLRRTFYVTEPAYIVVRGTATQLAQAAKLLP